MKKDIDLSEIDASFIISSFKNKERRNNPSIIPRIMLPSQEIEQNKKAEELKESEQLSNAGSENIVTESNEVSASGVDSITNESADTTKRTSRQRKAAFEEYQKTFLTTPKIKHRKPVFLSEEMRERLDEIARKLGEKGMSASGMIENMVIHHLKTYDEDIEYWRKL